MDHTNNLKLEIPCPLCNGSGTKSNKNQCKKCNGSGKIPEGSADSTLIYDDMDNRLNIHED